MPVFRPVSSSPIRQSPPVPARRTTLRRVAAMAACGLILPLAAAAQAQGQGQNQVAGGKPIRILVGAPAGGTTDTLARTIAQEMSQLLEQSVVVENRPGAGGNIAAELVARSAPDGSTLLMSFTSHTINATLYKKLPFDPVQDFTPVTLVATVPSVLVATPKLPASNVPELIRLARAEPGKLNFAIGSVGSSLHMAGDMFKMMTGTYIVNIPYKGTAPALTDVLAGQCELMFASTINVLPHVRAGKLKVLGVTSPAPMPQFPGAAPIGATVKGFESSAWFGLFGPAGMPAEVTQALYQAARKGLESPGVRKRLENDGAQPVGMAPEAFAAFVKQDVKRWASVVKYSGASPE
ncbi:tripartite tricarboxylate transporter substrate binding protein [Cupriavidus sp. AcVe19-1a]|uniref:tripartite tricarboxylate transporter substrate binding protein n=1 Tax=Cupriavidus sp. AcVe19-1a TaxID=2821359 RepID=UPI001AE8A166|nr:tripartite tricarboxylate transporter substrate binding protein [Cupriavidus sp. AcVe19-1a]MBP0629191.1 tripartite tricarboxylate transporter substrate binding protein [Cupriavidus sp. AcVe19-1a]